MQLLKDHHRAGGARCKLSVTRTPCGRNKELGALTLPSRRDFLELGRDLSVAPLKERFPSDISKFKGPEPSYARAWTLHKLMGGLTVFCVYASAKFGFEAGETAIVKTLGQSLFPAAKALFFGFAFSRVFPVSQLLRQERERAIAYAHKQPNRADH